MVIAVQGVDIVVDNMDVVSRAVGDCCYYSFSHPFAVANHVVAVVVVVVVVVAVLVVVRVVVFVSVVLVSILLGVAYDLQDVFQTQYSAPSTLHFVYPTFHGAEQFFHDVHCDASQYAIYVQAQPFDALQNLLWV